MFSSDGKPLFADSPVQCQWCNTSYNWNGSCDALKPNRKNSILKYLDVVVPNNKTNRPKDTRKGFTAPVDEDIRLTIWYCEICGGILYIEAVDDYGGGFYIPDRYPL